MGENICKWNNQQRINLQNIQSMQLNIKTKNKQPQKTLRKDLHRHVSKEDIKKVHAKMFNITNY